MDILGLVVSFAFVFAVLSAALLLQKSLFLDTRVTRKITHIAVSNWWFILYYMFTKVEFAVIGPIFFIIFNFLSYRYHLLSSMELPEPRRNLGTVYFPVSLLILVLLGYTGVLSLAAGGVGILVLGYGDGTAALIGEHFGEKKIFGRRGEKSWAGTIAMFLVSMTVVLTLTVLWLPGSLTPSAAVRTAVIVAAAAAAVELATPWGLDNITVPLAAAFLFQQLAPLG